ncbi:TetR/AcrR family transcriptional regulator [Kitasatospora cathayae]|uniref:TetR/AcrR family transcriptional regulator n=1 Tax=Kitasatospora cathayae TaxID=3004092 RepID=A0ABY7PXF0_9ACTN|nr:TetR/AcrR family transcriptional regulator [Kitasatospora sp. HUAS 3-15]WBP85066.1 TetR/AcrR family transcriptional regulator [Kitasatospora sp. HUAS 3-15]
MESGHHSGAAKARRGGSATPSRRADAERNIAAILAAATTCFAKNPNASMTEIAAAAGVGRVTLYGHFSSREALLSELMERALAEVATALDVTDLDHGPADEALRSFIRSSWQLLDRNLRMLYAARRALPAEAVHDHHIDILSAMQRLITRGQQEGAFRDDLPSHWLVGTVYALVQAAGDQVEAGQFTSEQALEALDATVASALRSPNT